MLSKKELTEIIRTIIKEVMPSLNKNPPKRPGTEPQLNQGVKIEQEHKSTYDLIKRYFIENKTMPPENTFYLSIAKDHIKEHPDYYSRLAKAGL